MAENNITSLSQKSCQVYDARGHHCCAKAIIDINDGYTRAAAVQHR
jgi:hypothetical protein